MSTRHDVYARSCLSVSKTTDSYIYARAYECVYSNFYLARAILATPGPCAIDFEAWPAAPEWHGAMAAAAAPPRRRKTLARAAAKAEAEREGRAHRRVPCVLALAHEDGREVVVRLVSDRDERGRQIPWLFAGRQADLVAHSAQFETEVLAAHGVFVDIDCTLIMAKALYEVAVDRERGLQPPVRFGLADLVRREFGRTRDKTLRDRDWRADDALDAEAVEYCLADARDALELAQLYRTRLAAEGLWDGYRLIAAAILPTALINLAGVTVDLSAHNRLIAELHPAAEQLETELARICGGQIRNPRSAQQVGEWVVRRVLEDDDPEDRIARFSARLRARTGTGWRRGDNGHLAITKHTKPRMAEATAPHWPDIAEYLVVHARWRAHEKLIESFGPGLASWVDDDGRLRAQTRMAGTVTMRHSCVKPNLQQQPRDKRFRALFRAAPGHRLVVCDYAQVEARAAAILAPDEALLDIYRHGHDLHREIAAVCLAKPPGEVTDAERSAHKPVTFAIIYGAGPGGIAISVGCTLERGGEILERFLSAYPGLHEYRERAPREAERLGYIPVRPGRRVLYDPRLGKGTQAINYPVQGACASIQMRALRRVHDVLAARPELGARVVGSIHDEILIESRAAERAEAAAALLQHEMRAALLEVFPEAQEMGADRLAAAEVVQSWAEKS